MPINGASGDPAAASSAGRASPRLHRRRACRDVDAELQRSLKLPRQSRRAGAGRHRGLAGRPRRPPTLRRHRRRSTTRPMASDDELIREIAAHAPGTAVKLRVVRDGREQAVTVKLAERPAARARADQTPSAPIAGRRNRAASRSVARPDRARSRSPDDQPASLCPRDERRADHARRAAERVVRRRARARHRAARDQPQARRLGGGLSNASPARRNPGDIVTLYRLRA